MYVGIDVGGTKTLIGVLNNEGVILEHDKYPTPKKYADFLAQLEQHLNLLKHHDFKAGGAGLPGLIDRQHGRIIDMGNLPWEDVPIQADLERICGCPMVIENDGKMGGLSEAMLLKKQYQKVLYLAIGTGIGVALIGDQKIDENLGDAGGRSLMLAHQGKLQSWEAFAGGRAIAERYDKPAHEITDEKTWRTICRYLAEGMIQLIAIMGPEVIVIGGSIGTYFDRYGKILTEELKKYELPMLKMPKLVSASRPEEAVVYGCYDLAKQVYGHE
jgi:predicted NBD/HSP70 family sugar kinase